SGSGQTVKAANQLIVATNIAALSEAVVFLEAYGVDLPAAIKVLGGGLAGSAVLNQKAQKILDRDFAAGFRIDLHHKDIGIVTAAAREAGGAIPVRAPLAQLMVSARGNGDGDLDHSGLFRTTQRLSGTQTSCRRLPAVNPATPPRTTRLPRRENTQGGHPHGTYARGRRHRPDLREGGAHADLRSARRRHQPPLLGDGEPWRHQA